MSSTIRITVVAKDGISLIGCPTTFHLPCPFGGSVIDGRDFYFRSDNLQQTWKFPPQLTPATLPAVSFPVAYIQSGGHDYYAIADQDKSPAEAVNQILADACNACCSTSPGSEPDETAQAPGNIIPTLMHMAVGQVLQDCNTNICTYSYYDTLPADGGVSYNLQFACNGVLTSSGNTKFTTKAAALAWAVGNLGSYGTWTNPSGQILKVSGTACSVGALSHTNF